MIEHMRYPLKLFSLLLVSLLISLPLSAGIYQWRDEQGQMHYGDRPPDTTAEPLQLRSTPAPAQPSPSEDSRRRTQKRLLEIYREERRQKQAEAERQRQQQAERQENCRRTRQRYARFERAGGIYQKDDQGGRNYLDQAAREQYMQDLRADVRRWCGED
jgi:hypothetical protein